MITPAALALASTILLTPPVRQAALSFGIVDRPASRKFHVVSTPYLGGVSILTGVLIANAVTLRLPSVGWQLLAVATAVAAVGLWDDIWPLAWRPKLAIEVAAALVAGAAIWLSFDSLERTALLAFTVLLGVGTMVLMANSFNLLDNIDAHCASVTLATCVGIALTADSDGGTEDLVALPVTVGAACVAFLMFNLSKKMKIFLGDSGSLLLGFITAATAILVVSHRSLTEFVLCLPFFFLIPALDTTTVVFDRKRHNVPIFTPGKDHLSHRLVRRGLTPLQSVACWAVLQLISSIAAYLFLSLDSGIRWLVLAPPAVLAIMALNATLKVEGLYQPSEEPG